MDKDEFSGEQNLTTEQKQAPEWMYDDYDEVRHTPDYDYGVNYEYDTDGKATAWEDVYDKHGNLVDDGLKEDRALGKANRHIIRNIGDYPEEALNQYIGEWLRDWRELPDDWDDDEDDLKEEFLGQKDITTMGRDDISREDYYNDYDPAVGWVFKRARTAARMFQQAKEYGLPMYVAELHRFDSVVIGNDTARVFIDTDVDSYSPFCVVVIVDEERKLDTSAMMYQLKLKGELYLYKTNEIDEKRIATRLPDAIEVFVARTCIVVQGSHV